MNIVESTPAGVVVSERSVFTDERGWFSELWRSAEYAAFAGETFVQDNTSYSEAGVLRGLHFQYDEPQAKLVSVLRGSIFDVAVDLRVGSPWFGHWHSAELSDTNGRQMYVPPGFAHGFIALTPAVVMYKCSTYYKPGLDASLLWSDPELAIEWPELEARPSAKDAAAPRLGGLDRARLLPFEGAAR